MGNWNVATILLSWDLAATAGTHYHHAAPHAPTVNIRGLSTATPWTIAVGALRLFGVDTPVRGGQCYSEAKDRLTGLAGNIIRVEASPRATGLFYGRQLFSTPTPMPGSASTP